ncbi:hypothetical protein TNCV_980871 [Trichonephila clavipes]|uniref:Uncharacterized protein n=1 Tax=Trichonephila clavipes TaxID=2585209 RepID=A0A8X6V3A7_TRICX|nr:hypothetical protein TNCV_980871 [Trichonephila clavipes]
MEFPRHSSRIFSCPNSAVVGVDRPSEREMSFVGPQQVTQPIVIFRNLFKRPHRKCPRFTESPGNNS